MTRPTRVAISAKDEILLQELATASGMDFSQVVSFLINRHARHLSKWFASDPYQTLPAHTAIAPDYFEPVGAIAPDKLPPLEL